MVEWDEGDPQPSLLRRMHRVLEEQPEQLWTPAKMRRELYPDMKIIPLADVSEEEYMISLISIAQANAVVQSTMEMLVHEGVLNKRECRVDLLFEIANNVAEYEELLEQWPEEMAYTDEIYYRLATDS